MTTAPGSGNVLFITLDQMRADLLHGDLAAVAPLPNLRRLMADGVTFANHFTVASPCGPARASLLTGLYAMNHRSVRNGTPLAAHHTNLALELRKAGREPLLFGYTDTSPDPTVLAPADPVLTSYEGLMPGFTEVLQMRFGTNYAWFAHLAAKGYDVSDHSAIVHPAEQCAERPQAPTVYAAEDSDTAFLTDEALKHLGQRQGQYWVAHLSYIRPHPPLAAPEPWNRAVSARDVPPARAVADVAAVRATHPMLDALLAEPTQHNLFGGFDGRVAEMTEATRQGLRAVYLGLAAEVDHHLGRIFDWLRDTGQWDDTLIVVTGDHAEMLGDHFLWGKETVYDQSFHVPLVIRDPRHPGAAGGVVEALTESVDVAPTLLEWCGAVPPAAFDGCSLLPFLRGEPPARWRDHVFIELELGDPAAPRVVQRRLGLSLEEANLAILREARWKYVHFNAGLPPLLFDLQADPDETRNLGGDPACRDEMLRMARKMLDHRMTHAFGALSGIAITGDGPVGRR